MRNLPAHQQHQEKSEQQETQRGESVLDANDLMVGGENVFAPETRIKMLMMAVIAVVIVTMTVIGFTIGWKLADRIVHRSFKNDK